MPITFGRAKEALSQYVGRGGKCPTAEEVGLFVHKVLQYMLYSGHHGNLRKFCFYAVKGCFTAPYELETPEKVKVDGQIGTVWDRWFEWHPGLQLDGCIAAEKALWEEPNYVCTSYDVPAGGSRIACISTCDEAEDAKLVIHGKDLNGRQIFTTHEGTQYAGEVLRIRKGELRYTQSTFATIERVEKSRTKGYVQLFAVNPAASSKVFLADYSPVEEAPQYRRFRLSDPNHCNGARKVTLLGRIRLKPYYLDNDFIPFDNLYTLELAGQAVNSQYNNDVQTATAKDATLQDMISRENEFKRVTNGQPVEVFVPLSGGAIKNIV